MAKELYVVYFESANYCGYGEHCLVWAEDEVDAIDQATEYAEEHYRVEDYDQFVEEHGEEAADECDLWASFPKEAYSLSSDEAEDVRGYLLDEDQKNFYPIVNENTV